MESGEVLNLDNPLELLDKHLPDAIETFAARHGLNNTEDGDAVENHTIGLLQRAAHYAQDPVDVNDEKLKVSNTERKILAEETKLSFWKQSRELRSAVIVLGGLSGICQGFTQSILNATGPPLTTQFDLHVFIDDPKRNNADLFTYGALTACVPLAAGILSPCVSDPMQSHWLGRRGAIALAAAVSIVATLGASFCQTVKQLIFCRVLVGASLGAKASIIAPFLAELAPVHLRGAILSTWQIADALGILLGFITWTIVTSFNPSDGTKWRVLNATCIIPTLILLVAAYMVPESYIFLMKKGKYLKATESACLYRKHDILGFRDLIVSHFQMETEERLGKSKSSNVPTETLPYRIGDIGLEGVEAEPITPYENLPGICSKDIDDPCSHSYYVAKTNFFQRLWHVITDRRCRLALFSGGTAMLAQALCGINAFAFFSSSLLDADIKESDSQILSVTFGVVNFVFGLITPFVSDRIGRTTLLLLGLPVMSFLMFILASVFEIDNSSRTSSIIAFTLLFTAVYSFTLGPAAFSLSAESFPSSYREAGMAICVSINMTSLGILLLIYPFITSPIGYSASLSIFGVIDLVAFVVCFFCCIDTKKRTLDEMHYSFDLGLRWHSRYRLMAIKVAYKHWTGVVSRWMTKVSGWTTGRWAKAGTTQASTIGDQTHAATTAHDPSAADGSSAVDVSTRTSDTEWPLIAFYIWARHEARRRKRSDAERGTARSTISSRSFKQLLSRNNQKSKMIPEASTQQVE